MQKYVLVGAGGTGSQLIGPVLAYLASWHRNNDSLWEFVVVDGDAYKATNSERQLFDPRYVGANKATAMAEMYSQYPIRAVDKYIGKEDLEGLLTEGTVMFLGVDNYSVRALVEQRALDIKNCVIINGGNERHDGTVQIWVREKGKNKTPRLSYGHPEIKYLAEDDRSAMTCAQAMEMPGGEQLIIANMAAAQFMITALWRWHTGEWKDGWTELNYDLLRGEVYHINMRERMNWDKDKTAAQEAEEGTLVPLSA